MKVTFLFILIALSFNGMSQEIKVMTYNIRYDNPGDGINAWSNRTEKLPALISKYDPDLIGLQEAMHNQLMTILEKLPQYGYIGVGRNDGKENGEYSAILYRKDRFEVVSSKTTWLSETPDVIGSKSWDTALTRILTHSKLKDKKTGKTFLFYNTHFDHVGKEARRHSAELILKTIESERGKQDMPVIVTGDFNSPPDEAAYKTIVASPLLIDSRGDSQQGTFCTFAVNGPPCRTIDYLFASKHWKKLDYKVITDNDGTNYPSDHLPVMATFELR